MIESRRSRFVCVTPTGRLSARSAFSCRTALASLSLPALLQIITQVWPRRHAHSYVRGHQGASASCSAYKRETRRVGRSNVLALCLLLQCTLQSVMCLAAKVRYTIIQMRERANSRQNDTSTYSLIALRVQAMCSLRALAGQSYATGERFNVRRERERKRVTRATAKSRQCMSRVHCRAARGGEFSLHCTLKKRLMMSNSIDSHTGRALPDRVR